MWGLKIVLFSFIVSLILLGVSNSAFADFYQLPIVIEHTNILNITDATISGTNTITTTIQFPAVNPTDTISVDLTRVPGTNNFISEFITFTSTTTNDAADKLRVVAGNTVQVNYGTPWAVNVINNNDPFPPSQLGTAKTVPLLLRLYNSVCNSGYGGDTDNDFICNNWETATGLVITYPAGTTYTLTCTPGATYATNPLGDQVCPKTTEKDMYVEIDYMSGHRPNLDALKNVVNAFQTAPPTNKINLHVFLDEQLPHAPSTYFPGTDAQPGILQIKSFNFGTVSERANPSFYNAKAQVFQYFLWAHDQTGFLGTSGTSDGANDGGVTLGSFSATVAGSRKQQEGTFMHELGHNLGLNHGGPKNDSNNCKPNLVSVMNYAYQFGDLVPNPNLDYSRKAIGTNTAGSTSLGLENALPNTAMNVANSDPSGLYMVYGIGKGLTTYQQLPQTTPAPPSWPPSPWQSIRNMSDNANPPHVVCAAPTTAIALTGYNQWSLTTMNHGSGNWLQGRSEIATGPITISTDKLDYSLGSTIQVDGTVGNISAEDVLIRVIAANGNVVTVDQLTVNPDGTFSTVLTPGGLWSSTGTYTIVATYQRSEQSAYIDISDYAYFEIPEDSWCISLEEAEKQFKHNSLLNMTDAPLCYTEITMDNVRAARLINLNNIIGNIQSLYDGKFITENTKDTLTKVASDIHPLILDDDIYSTLVSYNEFKNLVNDKVDNEYARTLLTTLVLVSTYTLNPVGDIPPPLPIHPSQCSIPDEDEDGVVCPTDLCENTPAGDKVDESGCTVSPPYWIILVVAIIIAIIIIIIWKITSKRNKGTTVGTKPKP